MDFSLLTLFISIKVEKSLREIKKKHEGFIPYPEITIKYLEIIPPKLEYEWKFSNKIPKDMQ